MTLMITLLICAALLAWLIYSYDLYDKEPWFMILLAVIAGAIVMWLAGEVQLLTIELLIGQLPFSLLMATVSSTHEEVAKLLVVVLIAVCFRKVFNDPMDGIIYGALVGIGAALIESAAFIRDFGSEGAARGELVRLLGHCIFGGITGFGVGLYVIRHRLRHGLLIACLLAAVLLHFAFNYLSFSQTESTAMHTVVAIAIMLTGLGLFFTLVLFAQRLSHTHFESEEGRYHRFGWPFNRLLRDND